MTKPDKDPSGQSEPRFDITEADIGRYVRYKSTGKIGVVSKDDGNGWLHTGVKYEWKGYLDDLEYVDVTPTTQAHSSDAQGQSELREALTRISEIDCNFGTLSDSHLLGKCKEIADQALAATATIQVNSTVSRTLAADTSDGLMAENSTHKTAKVTPQVEPTIQAQSSDAQVRNGALEEAAREADPEIWAPGGTTGDLDYDTAWEIQGAINRLKSAIPPADKQGVWVPLEPTEAMIEAGCNAWVKSKFGVVVQYKAMLAARPNKPAADKPEGCEEITSFQHVVIPKQEGVWQPIASAPRDGTPIIIQKMVRYLPYKPDGKRQMKMDGRWQEWNGYGWSNCTDEPECWQAAARPKPPADKQEGVWMPLEMTSEMESVGLQAMDQGEDLDTIYNAILAARPKPHSNEGGAV